MGLPQMGSNGGIQKWLVYNGKSMKIPPSNGWELGVPLFQETSKWVRRLTFKARSEPRSATDPVGSSLTPMAPGQEPTIQMVFCHQNTWSDRWHVTHSMTWENHIKSNVSSPKSTSSRIIRFSPVFSRAHSCLKSSLWCRLAHCKTPHVVSRQPELPDVLWSSRQVWRCFELGNKSWKSWAKNFGEKNDSKNGPFGKSGGNRDVLKSDM